MLTSPIILLEALIIKIEHARPGALLPAALRTQQDHARLGPRRPHRLISATGRFEPDKHYWVPTIFKFVKFRTMYVDANKRFPNLYSYEFDTHEEFRAAFYKLDNDPRVTPAGNGCGA